MFRPANEQYIKIPTFETITFIGDPGCDGLGASTMSIFAKALHNATGDFTFILGDLVPIGAPKYYKSVLSFIDQVATTDVYSLCGNHDSDNYTRFCGHRDYALYSDTQLILVLDNSHLMFSDETIQFAQEALENYPRSEILVTFHIPVPNNYTGNSILPEEWQKLAALLEPHRSAISAIITGHVHSYFRDTIDGYPLIVSGGGGARIEFVHDDIPVEERVYHTLSYSSATRAFTFTPLDPLSYTEELEDPILLEKLETAYINETQAHFRYKLFAEQMQEIGESELAHLFRALSDSEYRHAKNHYSALNSVSPREKIVEQAIRGESFEVEEMYHEDLRYCKEKELGLSTYTFTDSLEAEKVHLGLLKQALEKEEFSKEYYTCTSCGFTFTDEDDIQRCPICGAPHDKIVEVEKNLI